MTETIEKLNHSLTYQMSLGGRELYHSNVWCWLMKQNSAGVLPLLRPRERQRGIHSAGIVEYGFGHRACQSKNLYN